MKCHVLFRCMDMISFAIFINKESHITGHLTCFKIPSNKKSFPDRNFPLVRPVFKIIFFYCGIFVLLRKIQRPNTCIGTYAPMYLYGPVILSLTATPVKAAL